MTAPHTTNRLESRPIVLHEPPELGDGERETKQKS